MRRISPRYKNNKRNIVFTGLCFCILFKFVAQLVMLGPEQPYQKSKAKRRLGSRWQIKGSCGELLRSSVRVNYSRTDLRDPRFFANFSHNYANIRIVSNKTNISHPNRQFFTRELLNCFSNSASLRWKSQPSWRLDVIDLGQLTPHPGDRSV